MWQKMQEKLPTKPTEVFELPNGVYLFLSQTSVEKEMDPHRYKLFAQVRLIFVTIHEIFLTRRDFTDRDIIHIAHPQNAHN